MSYSQPQARKASQLSFDHWTVLCCVSLQNTVQQQTGPFWEAGKTFHDVNLPKEHEKT